MTSTPEIVDPSGAYAQLDDQVSALFGDAGSDVALAATAFVAAIEATVVASGTSHVDPGSVVAVAFDDGVDHTALSDAEFLTYVQRNYRVVQTGMPGTGSQGFGSCPLWFRSADASAATVSIQTLDASVPFEVV